VYWFGADIAFDDGNLTGYFASRPYPYSTFLIVNTITDKATEKLRVFASAFTPATSAVAA